VRGRVVLRKGLKHARSQPCGGGNRDFREADAVEGRAQLPRLGGTLRATVQMLLDALAVSRRANSPSA
jgi:hypothetical protein